VHVVVVYMCRYKVVQCLSTIVHNDTLLDNRPSSSVISSSSCYICSSCMCM